MSTRSKTQDSTQTIEYQNSQLGIEETILPMRSDQEEQMKISLHEASEKLKGLSENFVVLFRRGDFTAELFAPHEIDTQQPHEQDEVYIVASGSGVFLRGEERVTFVQGDFLFVPAGVAHRFEQFTEDFKTWVIFFGCKGGFGSMA
jgi:mannose-6-phosphate isomerase-like protein (cupin superfamily)